MSKARYHESLRYLHQEIQQSEFVDEGQSRRIERLSDNIREVLEHPGNAPFGIHVRLLESLHDGVTHFETSHPTLTGLMNSVINTLNNLGI